MGARSHANTHSESDRPRDDLLAVADRAHRPALLAVGDLQRRHDARAPDRTTEQARGADGEHQQRAIRLVNMDHVGGIAREEAAEDARHVVREEHLSPQHGDHRLVAWSAPRG